MARKEEMRKEIQVMEDRVRTGETVYVDAEGNIIEAPVDKIEEKEVEENATA